jgi:LacI family transcriptional regulator
VRGESLGGPAPRRVGIRDVAAKAGVAISTVSKVLSGRGDVSPSLRARVLEAASELGYEPNYLAQSLRRGVSNLIGLVASDIGDPFAAEIAAAAESVLRPAGYALVVMSSNRSAEVEATNIRHLHHRRVDSILITPSNEADPGILAALAEFDGPVVAIEGDLRGALAVDAVCADHRAGARAAVSHLIDLGHRRIAGLTGPLERRSGRERATGMQEAMTAAGLDGGATSIVVEHDAAAGERVTAELLDRETPPTAILAGSGPLLAGALRALEDRTIEIGRDVSLVGWDDGHLPRLFRPPIAVVDRDARGLGAAAANAALRRLRTPDTGPARLEIRPTTFIPRASCAAPPP